MDSETLSLIELVLVYGIVLALLFWQLWDVTRAQKKSKAERAAKELAKAEEDRAP
ncbi:MAG: hypothetical protein RLY86_250 [Pseudomonadota bacterium]|jgi:hypothetical protein